ncbi:MAG: DNA polymerase III subunit delta' [Candidatus Omnitrophica bacterium]|nr:DNA polymerase III subunit delta' [Candidatus Omnitrophota bacterium]
MSFKDIRGQDSAAEFLKRSVKNNKVSHAYIFAGPSGVGKKFAAINFAKAVNCLDPKDGDPCDSCVQCKKIDASNHPDVLIFSPAKEDASFGIDKIRLLTKQIGMKPYEGLKKVYILDSADSMTQEAQNSLLKTLEEPPPESVLILIAESFTAVFATIRSRAEKVRFFPVADKETLAILTDIHKIDKEKAVILARVSSGSIGKALKYNTDDFFKARKQMIDGLEKGTLADLDFDNLPRSELRFRLDVILTWYRDALVAKAGAQGSSELVNGDRLGPIREFAARSSFEALNNMIEQVILTGSFLDENANPKLAMSVLGMNLH